MNNINSLPNKQKTEQLLIIIEQNMSVYAWCPTSYADVYLTAKTQTPLPTKRVDKRSHNSQDSQGKLLFISVLILVFFFLKKYSNFVSIINNFVIIYSVFDSNSHTWLVNLSFIVACTWTLVFFFGLILILSSSAWLIK